MGWLSRMMGAGTPEPTPAPVPRPKAPEPDFVVIDVETACSRASSICQIGIVGFRGGEIDFEFETLVDPRDHFDPFNVNIHGIESHHVKGQPDFGSLHPVLHGHLSNRITVAHSTFDRGAISQACQISRKPEFSTRWLDSVMVARRAWPELQSHRLRVLADHLGLELNHHNALSDARAAGLVVVRAMDHTGLGLEDFFLPPIGMPARAYRKSEGSLKRTGDGDGPLLGECVAMTGDFTLTKSQMADAIAEAGGNVTATVTKKTTILVLGVQDPASFAGKPKSSKHIKADELIASGQPIRIMSQSEFMTLLT